MCVTCYIKLPTSYDLITFIFQEVFINVDKYLTAWVFVNILCCLFTGLHKMRSSKMQTCENEQRIKYQIKCEVVFAFYTLRRINCEIHKLRNATKTVTGYSHTRTFLVVFTLYIKCWTSISISLTGYSQYLDADRTL